MGEIQIRRWEPTDSIESITKLLHLAYGALARQGMHYNASHQPPEQTLKRLQGGTSFVALAGDAIVGTITVYESSGSSSHAYYRRPGLFLFGQFGVHPDFQGLGIAKRLYQTVEEFARSQGCSEIALDTAETAHQLIATYERWVFRIVDTADWDSTNYVSVIMAKHLR